MVKVKVVLAGGPVELTAATRLQEVHSLEDKVKVPFGGGYEHFEHCGQSTEVGGAHVPVFEWRERTRMAE
jgi:hypothetical protein